MQTLKMMEGLEMYIQKYNLKINNSSRWMTNSYTQNYVQ